jgi:hypothetical protein
MQNGNKNSKLALLADRMAILMSICIIKYGGKLNPWFRDSFYTGEAAIAIREMPEYRVSLAIIRGMVKREIARLAAENHKSANP